MFFSGMEANFVVCIVGSHGSSLALQTGCVSVVLIKVPAIDFPFAETLRDSIQLLDASSTHGGKNNSA
jgi:hypothetical protein